MTKFAAEEAIPQLLQDFGPYLMRNRIAYRTMQTYVRILKHFFSGYPPELEHFNKFLIETRSKYARSAMVHFLTMVKRQGLIPYVARVRIPPRKELRGYLEKKKILNIIKNIEDPKHRLVAMMQYDSGMRSHEIVGLERRNIKQDKSGDLIFYTVGKGGKELPFYVSKDTERAVMKYMALNKDRYLFLKGQSDRKITWIDNNCRYYRASLQKSREKLGIEVFGTHDFRRNFITEAYEKGQQLYREGKINREPLLWVRDLIGHSLTQTTERYIKEQALDRKEAVRSLRG